MDMIEAGRERNSKSLSENIPYYAAILLLKSIPVP
jgi:hypothetical protein